MTDHGLPALYALLTWWFSTGVILYLDGLPRWTFRWSMAAATAVLGLSFWGLANSAQDTTVSGAYMAFTWALLVWGWMEISFYMGVVTGPRRHACETGCSGWTHFGHALMASLHHEIAIVLGGMLVAFLTWDAPNQVGLWTYVILAVMHESARLNVFLGVPNVTEEFLPPHLDYLRSFIRKRSINPLLPASVTLGTCAATMLCTAALAPEAGPFDQAAFTFLGVLMIIAVAEHFFLVLPLNVGAMWTWSLKGRAPAVMPDADQIIDVVKLAEAPRVPAHKPAGSGLRA